MVKCKDCGFLALRFANTAIQHGYKAGEIIGADDIYRTNAVGSVPSLHRQALCFVLAYNLQEQRELAIEEAKAGKPIPNAIDNNGLVIEFPKESYQWQIYLERDCITTPDGRLGYVPWNLGLSPKEHQEMLDRQWMRDREDRRDRVQRRFLLALAALNIAGLILASMIGGLYTNWVARTVNRVQPPIVNNYIQLPEQSAQPTPIPTPTFTPRPTPTSVQPPTPAS